MSDGHQEKCVMCGMGWTRKLDQPRAPCPHCGEKNWDVEPDLSQVVGERTEYRIIERRDDDNLILNLGLAWIGNPDNNTQVRLPHRLKEKLRHAANDLTHGDYDKLVLSFQKINGEWKIYFRAMTQNEMRRAQTDRCRRHQWAIGIVQENFLINLRADLYQCDCPQDPPCNVCELAAKLAKARATKEGENEAGQLYIQLEAAVRQDLGRIP